MTLLAIGGQLVSVGGSLLAIGGNSPPPTASPVTNISVASTTSSTIAITFASPSSGTTAWNYRAHGATVWMPAPNGSSFGNSSGTFVGLASGSAYDIQAATTLGSSTAAAELDNVTTAGGTVIPPLTPTTNGNRLDVVLDQTTVAPGGTATGKLYPNGLWTGGAATVGGTSVSLPSSGSAPVSFSLAPSSAIEQSFAVTNTAGLYNPYPAPLTVMATSSGTARTIGAALGNIYNADGSVGSTYSDMVTFQRDAPSGAPTGFSSSRWTKGWGEVWFNLTSLGGATGGLFVRLYDAMSSGATTTAGTGTELTSGAVQVYGAVSAAGQVRVLLPASASIYYADLATDAAFTNPVRIAQRFRVGVVVGAFSRSFECGLTRDYNDGGTSFSTIYTKTASLCSSDHRYGATTGNGAYWFLQDGTTKNSFTGENASSGAQEFGRLIESQLGVCVGITGSTEAGGDFDQCVAHDGSFSSGFADTVRLCVNGKFRYLWMAHSGWTGDSTYPTQTHAEIRTRMLAAVDWAPRTYPACAVIGWVHGNSGWFGQDGSANLGYVRNNNIILGEIEPANRMVVSKENTLWNEFAGGHATMGARQLYVQSSFRKLMAVELAVMGGFQTTERGPRLATTGTVSGRTLSIPITAASGATLSATKATYADPAVTYSTASPAELAPLFSVYAAGLNKDTGKPIRIDTATLNTGAGTVDLVLTGSSGVTYADNTTDVMPSGFSVDYAADFGLSNTTLACYSGPSTSITDSRTGNGIAVGWHALPALDIAVS